jgi:hypothetical protein
MEVELFVRDRELGIEFEMKFDNMAALIDQVYNIGAIVDKANATRRKREIQADLDKRAAQKLPPTPADQPL